MPQYSFLVREKLERDRIYKINAKTEEEAYDLLDGFKQEPTEHTAPQENIVVSDYDIKECYRSSIPEVSDLVMYKGELGFLSIIRNNWIINTKSHTVPIKVMQLSWDEDQYHWNVLEVKS